MTDLKKRMDIERLVEWALREQGLGFVGRVSGGLDACELGTRVDISPRGSIGAPGWGYFTDPDAMVVRKAIDVLPAEAAALVLRFGRTGLRPDWCPEGYGGPEQMARPNGELRWIYANPNNRRGERWPMLDWPAYRAHVELVDFARAEWRLWHAGLAELVTRPALLASMTSHIATGPDAPAEPWAGQAGPVPHFTGDDLRAKAQAPVRARAGDWSVPVAPIRRRPQAEKKPA